MLGRYWDWTLDWENPSKSPIWDAETGFGGDGNLEQNPTVGNGSCLSDGPFKNYEVLFANLDVQPHCLSRGFGRNVKSGRFEGGKFSPDAIKEILNMEDLHDFSLTLEKRSHDAIPNGIGGDFYLFTAPNGKQMSRFLLQIRGADLDNRSLILCSSCTDG